MKKVLIRLIVAGLIVALVVFVLLNTVLKVENSIKTHNEIAIALSENGDITTLNSSLQDDAMVQEYGTTINLINYEIQTLSHLYTKIIVTKANSDTKTNSMLESLQLLKSSLKKSNDKISKIKKSNATGSLKTSMIKELKNELNDSINYLIMLNHNLIEYLINYYYNNVYDSYIALNYMKTAYIQKYFSSQDNDDLNMYETFAKKCDDTSINQELSLNYDFNILLFNASSINIYELITNENEYLEKLNDEQKIKANQIKNCITTTVYTMLTA